MSDPMKMTTYDRIRQYQPDLDRYVMTCDPASLVVPAPIDGLVIVEIGRDAPVDLIRETMTINEQGFDPGAPEVDEAAAEAFRPDLTSCLAVSARWHGQPVAAGMFRPVRDGLSELVGIATLVPFRRRGFAGAVTSALALEAFQYGAPIVFLTTDDEGARRVYRRLGFRNVYAKHERKRHY